MIRAPRIIIGCSTGPGDFQHCVNCDIRDPESEKCLSVREALEATVRYNGRVQDIPMPLNDEQRDRIEALKAARSAEEMYALAGVADITCSVRREE